MDNLWIFIVIVGAVISLVQKNAKNSTDEGEKAPNPNPQEEWERQLRELLGEGKTAKSPSPTTLQGSDSPTPRPISPKPATVATPRRVAPIAPAQTAKRVEYAAAVKPHKQANRVAGEQAKVVAKENKAIANPSTYEMSNENIGQILDDFTMEKAVIYAEILKPKYEEY